MTFSEAYAKYGPDTIAISEAIGVHESVAANQLARLKGETEPHPGAPLAYQKQREAELREIRARRPA